MCTFGKIRFYSLTLICILFRSEFSYPHTKLISKDVGYDVNLSDLINRRLSFTIINIVQRDSTTIYKYLIVCLIIGHQFF